jgi:hypothetical protein
MGPRSLSSYNSVRIPNHTPKSSALAQARQSGLTDAEIAMLIGDKTGPGIIAAVCGDLRQDLLLAQAKRIQLRATARCERETQPVTGAP